MGDLEKSTDQMLDNKLDGEGERHVRIVNRS